MKRILLSLLVVIGLSVFIEPVTATAVEGCSNSLAQPHSPKRVEPPQLTLKSYPTVLTLETNCGDIDILLVPNSAPITTTAILTLSRAGFYDETFCHRLTTSGLYVIQCGDPTATGTGGTNWQFVDENLPSGAINNYPKGTVGMANSGPNTNSSQFFFTFEDSTFGPNYSIWGRVIAGLDVLEYVAANGVIGGGNDGKPVIPLVINSIVEQDSNYLKAFNKGLKERIRDLPSIESSLNERITELQNELVSLEWEKQDLLAGFVSEKQNLIDSYESENENLLAENLLLAQENELLLEALATAKEAAAELKAKQDAEAKAAAELKAKQDAEAKAAASKKTTLTCIKGKTTKKVTAVKPVCPKGYKKK